MSVLLDGEESSLEFLDVHAEVSFFFFKFSCPQRCYLFYQEDKLSIVVFCHQTCRKILEGDSSMHLSLCIPWTM